MTGRAPWTAPRASPPGRRPCRRAPPPARQPRRQSGAAGPARARRPRRSRRHSPAGGEDPPRASRRCASCGRSPRGATPRLRAGPGRARLVRRWATVSARRERAPGLASGTIAALRRAGDRAELARRGIPGVRRAVLEPGLRMRKVLRPALPVVTQQPACRLAGDHAARALLPVAHTGLVRLAGERSHDLLADGGPLELVP